jgi:two-component system chemotaxis response regulator CheY
MIVRTLEKMGVQHFLEAEDGKEAMPMIQENKFDLIISDYNMPKVDGHELLKFIRTESNQPHVPVLMVTTEGDTSKLQAIQQQGVSAIVDKPFDANTVKQLIEAVFNEV